MRKSIVAIALLLAIALLGAGCSRGPSDSQISTNVKARLFSDVALRGSALKVVVKNGVATISGRVPSVAARYEAFKLASETPGVNKVNDDMTINESVVSTRATAPTSPTAPQPKTAPRFVHPHRVAHRVAPARQSSASQIVAETPPDAQPESAAVSSEPAPTLKAVPVAPVALPPKRITIPQGTRVDVRMIDSANSSVNHVGDILHASLSKPIKIGKNLIAPVGTNVYLQVVQVKSAGHFKGKSELRLELYRIVIQGTAYPLISNDYVDRGESRTKRALLTILGSGAVGAAIGAIAGGGKGAAIGAAAGAGAGTVYQGATKGKAVNIPSEALLKFKLEQPATVTLNTSVPAPLPAQ